MTLEWDAALDVPAADTSVADSALADATPDGEPVEDAAPDGPPPCVDLNVANTDLVMAELVPGDFVLLWNPTDTDIDIDEDDPDYRLSPYDGYTADLSGVSETSVVVPAKSYARIPFPAGFTGETIAGGNLALFDAALMRARSLIDYLCWGTASGETFLDVATEGETPAWTGECLAALEAGQSIRRLPGSDGAGASSYTIGAAVGTECTP